MLKLRQQHLDAFAAQKAALFTGRVVAHVKAVWPAECAELGDAAVVEGVQSAIQRAVAFGFILEHDLVRFVDLTFILAADFDTNPLAGWTRPICADRTLSPTARMDRLYQQLDYEFANIEKRKGILT